MDLSNQIVKNVIPTRLFVESGHGDIFPPFGWDAVTHAIFPHIQVSHRDIYSLGLQEIDLLSPRLSLQLDRFVFLVRQ